MPGKPGCRARPRPGLSPGATTSRCPYSRNGHRKLVAAAGHLVARRALAEVREHLRLRLHVRYLVVPAHERLHRVQGAEPQQGHELHVLVSLAPDRVDGAESGNAPRFDAGDDRAPARWLIGISVVLSGPASPLAARLSIDRKSTRLNSSHR